MAARKPLFKKPPRKKVKTKKPGRTMERRPEDDLAKPTPRKRRRR